MTRLTTEQFEAIRERAEKATTGSWYTEITTFGDNTYVHVQPGIAQDANEADAEFIANAREDIPALLAEVERFESRWALLEYEISQIREFYDRNPSAEREVHVVDDVITKISEVKSTEIVVTPNASEEIR